MHKYYVLAASSVTIIGVVFLVGSARLGLGTIWDPGPGLVPFMAACLLVVLSFGVILEDRLKKTGVGLSVQIFGGKKRRGMALMVVLSLFGYLLIMYVIGFKLSTLLLLIFLFKAPEKQSWKAVITAAFLTMACAYFVFNYFLKIEFPKGILGF